MSTSLKFKTVENIGYNTFARALIFVFQAFANIILARNLVSGDYGIVGFAMVFISFLSQFSDLGINSAVVQRGELDERGLYTGFTIKVVLGVVVCVASLVISPISKWFFDNSAVVGVIRILSLNFIISSFAFLPNSLLLRELNYKKLFIPHVGAAAVSSVVSITLAFSGFNYWSIVMANICSAIASVILLNVLKPVRIRFRFDRKVASEFVHFGGNLFLSGIIVFAMFNAGNFIIGAVKGSDVLGYYTVAFSWGAMVCSILGAVVLSVLFPTLSRIQQDRKKLKNAYLKVSEYVAFIGVLTNLGLLAVSEEFLFFVLGHGTDKWLPALTAFRILCIYGIFWSLLEPIGNAMLAIGKTREMLFAHIAVALLHLGLLYPSLEFFGIEGVAATVTLSYVVFSMILLRVLRRELNLELVEWVKSVYPAVISLGVAIAVLYLVRRSIPFSFFGVVQKAVLCALIYFIVYGLITGWRMLSELKDILTGIQLREKVFHLGEKL